MFAIIGQVFDMERKTVKDLDAKTVDSFWYAAKFDEGLRRLKYLCCESRSIVWKDLYY
jgi:hypothetical protein